MSVLIEVAVGAPVRGTFTYEFEGEALPEPGRRLLVPFGRRRAIGFCLGPAASAPEGRLRAVESLLDDGPLFPPDVLALVRFAATYYLWPLGEALRGALPPTLGRVTPPPKAREASIESVSLLVTHDVAIAAVGRARSQLALVEYLEACGGTASLEELKRAVKNAAGLVRKLEEKKLVALGRAVAAGRRDDPAFAQPHAHALTEAQRRARDSITAARGTFAPFLLLGVTGSGKTEVYLQAIEATRAADRGALVLVPEIALTPQLAGRFRSRFGAEVAVLHSGLSDRERAVEHRRLLDGEAQIALGVRSAVFSPVQRLGLVVVDEEHEPSFKQEEKLRYHGRDLAIYRARLCDAPCVLGSATPSLETLKHAQDGRYTLLELPRRVDGRAMPEVELVSLASRAPKTPRAAPREPTLLSNKLRDSIAATLAQRRQTILFLNRRGHAPLVLCPSCGESARCPDCDVTLTHHLRAGELRCHYCDHRAPMPTSCPSCAGELLVLGVGTERVEAELHVAFPSARVVRLDRDAVTSADAMTRVLSTFARGEADILVGTQMVAKGHDFPGVTLVGALLADVGLGLPDFRAAERTFQLLAQVAGRAGRGDDTGRVLIQTFHPESPAISHVVQHDFSGFARGELARRQAFGYPPYRRMLCLRIDGADEAKTERDAKKLAAIAKRWSADAVRVVGAAPAPISRLRGRYRFQVLLFADGTRPLQLLANRLLEVAEALTSGVRVAFDVDPISML